jgi:hypothetical protein
MELRERAIEAITIRESRRILSSLESADMNFTEIKGRGDGQELSDIPHEETCGLGSGREHMRKKGRF